MTPTRENNGNRSVSAEWRIAGDLQSGGRLARGAGTRRFGAGGNGAAMSATRSRSAAPADPALPAARLRALRAALHEQREFRIEQLSELDRVHGSGDATSDVTVALRAGARFALTQIEAALDRLRTGRFGVCIGCGARIASERLEILPMAALCVGCEQRCHAPIGRSRSC